MTTASSSFTPCPPDTFFPFLQQGLEIDLFIKPTTGRVIPVYTTSQDNIEKSPALLASQGQVVLAFEKTAQAVSNVFSLGFMTNRASPPPFQAAKRSPLIESPLVNITRIVPNTLFDSIYFAVKGPREGSTAEAISVLRCETYLQYESLPDVSKDYPWPLDQLGSIHISIKPQVKSEDLIEPGFCSLSTHLREPFQNKFTFKTPGHPDATDLDQSILRRKATIQSRPRYRPSSSTSYEEAIDQWRKKEKIKRH